MSYKLARTSLTLASSETTVLKTRFGPGDAGDPLSPSIAFERTSTERSCHLPKGPGLSRPSIIRYLLTNPPKPYDLSWQRLSDVLRFRKNMRIIPDGFRQAYCSQLSAAPVISGTWEYLRHDYLQKSASQVRSTSMVGLTLLMAQRPRVARECRARSPVRGS